MSIALKPQERNSALRNLRKVALKMYNLLTSIKMKAVPEGQVHPVFTCSRKSPVGTRGILKNSMIFMTPGIRLKKKKSVVILNFH